MQSQLASVVREVEEHVAQLGWDQPVRLFAIVLTANVLESNPELNLSSEQLYTSVEQEGLDPAAALDDLLGTIYWPDQVAGAIVVMERVLIPQDSTQNSVTPSEPTVDDLLNHPDRQDVRMVSAVMRDKECVNAIRYRKFDHADEVSFGVDLVPRLNEALLATFE
ncbi:MAG: hypothetical protein F2839_03375 [Actinobacteria bacterium]|uniref:Unannotated protein n=1 Tax=freshwater metagenome TaxID=449393 RepID=A0A6J5Z8Y9_9ZZZZ|nr:hypothetical protein [Actinomycetota bacterium]